MCLVAAFSIAVQADEAYSSSLKTRGTPWGTSRFEGTPLPPPAFHFQRMMPKLDFKAPLCVQRFPEQENQQTRWVVAEQNGRILTFLDGDPQLSRADVLADFETLPPPLSGYQKKEGLSFQVFSLVFHPNFSENRFLYICYVMHRNGKLNEDGTHIARFTVRQTNPPTIDVQSEQTVLTCLAAGHNGCTLEFGNDGKLYISIGDLADPNPPDPFRYGQSLDDLYGAILRIDVDQTSVTQEGQHLNYAIPPDNPFVSRSDARGEVFAYGFRNPWRMSVDRVTGDLWVGDVGWEAYEMVYRVRAGGNYGWSIKEGPGDVVLDQKPGPTPIQPADIWLGHEDAASVTGGFVYRGKQFPELVGKYIFGDWITRRYWAAGFNDKQVFAPEEIALSEVKPICFALDAQGEIVALEYVDWGQPGGLYKLVRNPAAQSFRPGQFPQRLSQSGLFSDLKDLTPQPGVHPYQINSSMWMDGAEAKFHVAIPGEATVKFYQQPQKTFNWFKSRVMFPVGSVLAKTYIKQGVKVETQISHLLAENDWRFYSYRWQEDQSDAQLLPAAGAAAEFTTEAGQTIRWDYASQAQCRVCHTPWSDAALGFLEEQLRKPHQRSDDWRQLQSLGLIELAGDKPPASDQQYQPMTGLDDPHYGLSNRVRSYLHSNCAHCHQRGGNASVNFDLRWIRSQTELSCLDKLPMKGDCGIEGAKLIKPGAPEASTIYSRMAKLGGGRMPHIGSQQVDVLGVQQVAQWIRNLPSEPDLANDLAMLTRPVQLQPPEDRLAATKRLLKSIPGAILFSQLWSGQEIHPQVKAALIPVIANAPPLAREYVEHLLPAEIRLQRLGQNIQPNQVLDLTGDTGRGKQLFIMGAGQCNQCHLAEGVGKSVGPALDAPKSRLASRDQLLEQILKPSAIILDEFRSYRILTIDGQSHLGRITARSDQQLQWLDQQGQLISMAAEDVELVQPSTISLMPENLFSTLSAQQAADLLAYLWILHSKD